MAVNIAHSMFPRSISPVPGPSGLQVPNASTSYTEMSTVRPDSALSTPAGISHKRRLPSTPNIINKRLCSQNNSASSWPYFHLDQSADPFAFTGDDSEMIDATEQAEALDQAVAGDGDLDNAEPSEDRAASTSGLAGLDPATRAVV